MNTSVIEGPPKKANPMCPAGTHVARLVQVIDMGTIDSVWQGKTKKRRELRLAFETPTKRAVFDEVRGPEPFVVGRYFGASLNDKSNLTPVVRNLLGHIPQHLDLALLVDRPCLITVSHAPKKDGSGTYPLISTVAAPSEDFPVPAASTPTFYYHTSMLKGGTWDKLPTWLKERIEKCDQFVAAFGKPASASAPASDEDGAPF